MGLHRALIFSQHPHAACAPSALLSSGDPVVLKISSSTAKRLALLSVRLATRVWTTIPVDLLTVRKEKTSDKALGGGKRLRPQRTASSYTPFWPKSGGQIAADGGPAVLGDFLNFAHGHFMNFV